MQYLIFLDTEANGLDLYTNRLVEIAFMIVDLQTSKEVVSYETIIQQSEKIWKNSDPVSLKMNGFTFEKCVEGISETKVQKEIISLFQTHQISRKNSVYLCQNPSFDRAFFTQIISSKKQEELNWPYHWLDLASMFWYHMIKKGMSPFDTGISKDKIAKYLSLPSEEMPHRAMNGVKHLKLCYDAFLKAQ